MEKEDKENATTQKEAPRPLGVIGCLLVGFEMVGRHLWLMTLPVLLDLLLWLGPQLSIAPLVEQFAGDLLAQPLVGLQISPQFVEALREFGEQYNLLSLLSALPLLHVPSLLTPQQSGLLSPLGDSTVFTVGDGSTLIAWIGGLLAAGMVLGFFYLKGMARRVGVALRSREAEAPAAAEEEQETEQEVEQEAPQGGATGKFVRIFSFALVLLIVGVGLAPIWLSFFGIALVAGEFWGSLIIMVILFLAGYVVLHLTFVVHGVLVKGRPLLRAAWESVALMHVYMPYVFFLLLLVSIIGEGLEYVWGLPASDSWFYLVGILGHGCVATALTAATFAFYHERIGTLQRAPQQA